MTTSRSTAFTPPTDSEIFGAVQQQLDSLLSSEENLDLRSLAERAARAALGLDRRTWDELDADAPETFPHTRWQTFTYTLGVPIATYSAQVAVVFNPHVRCRSGRWNALARRVRQVARDTGIRRLAFVTADVIAPAVLETIPEEYTIVVCPVTVGDSRLSLPRLRPHASPADARPLGAENAQEIVSDRGALLGWAQDRIIWLRFHPYLRHADHRMTFARADDRDLALATALRAAKRLLDNTDTLGRERDREAWQQAIRTAVACAHTLAERARETSEQIAQASLQERDMQAQTQSEVEHARSQIEQLRSQLARLEAQLPDLEQAAAEAAERVAALPDPHEAARVHMRLTADRLAAQLEAVRELPMVQSVQLTRSEGGHVPLLAVRSWPVRVPCAGTLREAGPVTITVNMISTGWSLDVQPDSQAPHPLLSSDTDPYEGSIVPLAEAMARMDLRALCQLALAPLTRPVADAAEQLPVAADGARPGFANPQAEQARANTDTGAGAAGRAAVPAGGRRRRRVIRRRIANARAARDTNSNGAGGEPPAVSADREVVIPTLTRRQDPTGQQTAILRFVAEAGGPVSAQDVYTHLTANGFEIARMDHVRVILRRMTQRGYLSQARRGRWQPQTVERVPAAA